MVSWPAMAPMRAAVLTADVDAVVDALSSGYTNVEMVNASETIVRL